MKLRVVYFRPNVGLMWHRYVYAHGKLTDKTERLPLSPPKIQRFRAF